MAIIQQVKQDRVLNDVAAFVHALPLFAGVSTMEMLCTLWEQDQDLFLRLPLVEKCTGDDVAVYKLWELARRVRRVGFSPTTVNAEGCYGVIRIHAQDTIEFAGPLVARVNEMVSVLKLGAVSSLSQELTALLGEYRQSFERSSEDEDD